MEYCRDLIFSLVYELKMRKKFAIVNAKSALLALNIIVSIYIYCIYIYAIICTFIQKHAKVINAF